MGAGRMILFVICSLWFVAFTKGTASRSLHKPLKIAIFAPVYLDSAFEGPIYKLGKNNLPRYMLPGLDFYNGAMMAVDSLNKEHAAVEVLFFDTKNTIRITFRSHQQRATTGCIADDRVI
jgi:hypothetical protein